MDDVNLTEVVIKDIYYFITINLNQNEMRSINNRGRYGLVFVSSGKLYYECNGRRYLSSPNHVLLLTQGSTYKIFCEEKSCCPLIDFETATPLNITGIYSFYLNDHAYMLRLFQQLDNLWTHKKSSYKLRCISGVYEMLARLNDLYDVQHTMDYRFEQIRPSIKYLEANYTNPELSNELLAEQSNISTVYFRKIFTEKYGISPMKYVQMKRIEKAQDMLKGFYQNVSSVAEATGFNSIYHFSRTFKDRTGHSPTEYIKYYAEHMNRDM